MKNNKKSLGQFADDVTYDQIITTAVLRIASLEKLLIKKGLVTEGELQEEFVAMFNEAKDLEKTLQEELDAPVAPIVQNGKPILN